MSLQHFAAVLLSGAGTFEVANHAVTCLADAASLQLQVDASRVGSPSTEPTVIAPTADLLGVPWALLPSLVDVPVTVAPSLRQWARARPAWTPLKSTAFVEGPNIASAAEERRGIASAWGRSSIVTVASVAEVLPVLASVDVVHFACHGDRRLRDGRFARLVLRDGDHHEL